MKKNHFKAFLGILAITGFLVLPFLVFAQETPDMSSFDEASSAEGNRALSNLEKVGTGGGYQEASLPAVAGIVVRTALSLLGIIFITLIIIGGYKWLTAGGEEKQVEDAKNYIKRAIIGLIIVISAWAIWTFVITRINL